MLLWILGQRLVQYPGGKLRVLHSQQTGGMTISAGNLALKKGDDESEESQQQQVTMIDDTQCQVVQSDGTNANVALQMTQNQGGKPNQVRSFLPT